MRVLIAEDDFVSRRLLERSLQNWHFEVITTEDGEAAWNVLNQDDCPSIAILDWMMPKLDGVEVCRRVRKKVDGPYVYLILLTAKGRKEDITDGLSGGADDYITKPFDKDELQARIRVGERVVDLERALAAKVAALEETLTQVRQLKDLLPICMYCKKVRDDQDYWHQIENYIHSHTGTDFSHGICPDCFAQIKRSMNQLVPEP